MSTFFKEIKKRYLLKNTTEIQKVIVSARLNDQHRHKGKSNAMTICLAGGGGAAQSAISQREKI